MRCANRGHFGGTSGDEIGVHVCGVLIVKNARSLFQNRKFALSSKNIESRIETIKRNMSKHPDIYQMVDPCPEKLEVLKKTSQYAKSRGEVRRNRAKEKELKEEFIGDEIESDSAIKL